MQTGCQKVFPRILVFCSLQQNKLPNVLWERRLSVHLKLCIITAGGVNVSGPSLCSISYLSVGFALHCSMSDAKG